jgi:membrane protein implicated in regulation of membrane protease activity
MTNRTIAIVFVVLSWLCFIGSVIIAFPLFIIYSVVCIFLSSVVYHRENKK